MTTEKNDPALDALSDNGVASALLAGSALGNARQNPHPDSPAYAIVPPGHELAYLTREDAPHHVSGTVAMNDTESFLEYWKRQSSAGQSYIYGSMEPGQFVAVLNEHGLQDPDWRDHRCVYKLEHSREFRTWAAQDRKAFDGNEAFALWLEDNLVDITDPEPSRMMELALNFRVKQINNFGKVLRLQDGNVQLEYTSEVDGNSSGVSKAESMKMPELFKIRIPVFKGLQATVYDFEARFRFRLLSGSLKIWYELVRPHKVVERAFKDMLGEIEKGADTKVLFGTP